MPIAKLRLAALLALGLTAASPAGATVMMATFTGTISSGADFIGAFGPPLTTLEGADFKEVVIYDTGLGMPDPTFPDGESRIGGVQYGLPDPILKVLITINSHMVRLDPTYLGGVGLQANRWVFIDSDPPNDGTAREADQSVTFSANAPASLDTPFSRTVAPCDEDNCGVFVQGPIQDGSFLQFDYAGIMNTQTITVERFTGVPEPACWALLLSGFGLLGAALRLRRRGSLSAA